MDETLIHTEMLTDQDNSSEKIVEVKTESGIYKVKLRIRPYALEVLTRLKQNFEIGLFTASQEHYAQAIIG